MKILTCERATHHSHIASAIALTLALAASAAPAAWADPPPFAHAEAAAANHATPASAGPCSEVCAGGGYGSVNATARIPATAVSCGDVCSGYGYGPVSAPASVVRVVAPGGGFDWGDAGIGAGGALALTMIGVGGALAATNRRGRHTHDQRANANS